LTLKFKKLEKLLLSREMAAKRILIFLFLCIGLSGFSQNPLNKRISVYFSNEPIETALEKIQTLGGFYFSFNSKVIDLNKNINYKSQHEQVIHILNNILGPKFTYKHRGNYIIIQEAKPTLVKKKKVVFKGKISNSSDSSHISDATIYEIDKLKSTSTNQEGDFNLTVSSEKEEITVLVSKENFKDTVLSSNQLTDSGLTIFLTPLKDSILKRSFFKLDSLSWLKVFYTRNVLNTIKNVNLSENRTFQISLVPFVGTNGKMSGKITNRFSVNLIGGYAYGLNGLELGGAFNILKDTMRGVQMAGVGNIVGGSVKGLQLGGAFNYCLDTVVGAQFAGAINVTRKEHKGVQAAGAVNIAKTVSNGGQLAGAFNHSKQIRNGFQIAGAFNYSSEIKSGFQIAGAININKSSLNGFQLTSLLNYTRKLNGFQIGLINISDSVVRGMPIGLFSYVKSGFHRTEFSYSDYLNSGISFRTGVHSFYTIFSLDYYHHDNDPLTSFGFGFGTQRNFNDRLFGNIEVSSHKVIATNTFYASFQELNMLNKLNVNLGFNFNRRLALVAGPSLNLYLSDNSNSIADYENFTKRKSLYTEKVNNTTLRMNLGYRVALRF
jgi:hypothetical protein